MLYITLCNVRDYNINFLRLLFDLDTRTIYFGLKPFIFMGQINLNEQIGKIYNRWTVIKFIKFRPYKKSRAPVYLCRCKCGKEKEVSLWDLKRTSSKSCGCLRREVLIKEYKSGLNALFRSYKKAAEKRNYSFNLSFEYFSQITKKNCYYCGAEPASLFRAFSKHTEYIYNGIDRKENTNGYDEENVVPCCKICNRAKWTLGWEDFIKWIKGIKKTNFELSCSSCEA